MQPTSLRPKTMTSTALYAFLGISFLLAGCTDKGGTTADGGTAADGATEASATGTDAAASDASATDASKGLSVSCYTDVQFVCEELPAPTANEEESLKVVCSSGSGDFQKPAKCPPAGFLGKCTFTTDKTNRVRRYYTGAEGAYQADYCVNTAQGIWSTTF